VKRKMATILAAGFSLVGAAQSATINFVDNLFEINGYLSMGALTA